MNNLVKNYQLVRDQSVALCQPLAVEDYVIQVMADVSPPKWHLAHVTWFFETFILRPYVPKYKVFHKDYDYIFNSYYEALGKYHPRESRGLLARPTVAEIYEYRDYVDAHMQDLLKKDVDAEVSFRTVLGINHEQQHQELLLMDTKYNFANNPLHPVYAEKINNMVDVASVVPLQWQNYAAGVYEIGYSGQDFAYDNECPRHRVYVESFQLGNRLVTNGEYLEFIAAGGYENPLLWLADGWSIVEVEHRQAPLYWEKVAGKWQTMTLHGLQPLVPEEPVCHISYYEADAYARFVNARLPTEAEWEVVAAQEKTNTTDNFLEQGLLHPRAAQNGQGMQQLFGDLWEWTQSPYVPYRGFKPFKAPLSEYNGKFACNQFVLRGGCAVTPVSHFRPSYRNFYYPHQRWPFTGIRLARDI